MFRDYGLWIMVGAGKRSPLVNDDFNELENRSVLKSSVLDGNHEKVVSLFHRETRLIQNIERRTLLESSPSRYTNTVELISSNNHPSIHNFDSPLFRFTTNLIYGFNNSTVKMKKSSINQCPNRDPTVHIFLNKTNYL